MVLFSRNAATKGYLLAHRVASASQQRGFTYLIKDLSLPSKKVPHPEHVKSKV